MNVTVTGGSGYIGTRLTQVLEERGHQVRALGRRDVDLAVRPLPPGLFDGADVVVHAAAHLPASYADPAEAQRCMDVNGLGTLAVLAECARRGVRKLVHLSTNLYRLSTTPVTEDAPFDPSPHASYYLVSKAAGDYFASHARGSLDVIILRLGSVYGPGSERGIVGTFARRLLAGQHITVEDGAYQADFVYIDDVARVVLDSVESAGSDTYNVGSGTATTPKQLASVLAGQLGVEPELVRYAAAASPLPRGFSALDCSRARAQLGYSARELHAGLGEYVRWMRSRS